jgi:hypothetical protein
MEVITKEKYTLIKDIDSDVENLILKIDNQYDIFKNFNLILDVSKNKNITITTLNHIKILSKKHKKNKKSLVIVAENIDYNKVSNQLNVVPTIIEATDIIELEEIERDLGF